MQKVFGGRVLLTFNLPTQVTPFIGRDNELAHIADLLLAPDCRLLTLIGPGGIGKTRLALEAVQRCRQFNGVCFIPLQPLNSPDFILPAIAASLQFTPYGDQAPKTQLFNFLHEKNLLLVIDNFEHLSDGVDLLSEILEAVAEVKILVTSRERLRLREEWVLEIGGLDYPTTDTEANIEHYSTVALFVQQARRTDASFTLTDKQKPAVIRICRAVGGMPLGVELAAAWVRTLSCEAIADELAHNLNILETSVRNVEPRHRTMRAAFEPTWNRLTDEERRVFINLSVFRGGFTREAAEYVASAPLRTLLMLMDKSLLRISEDGRYDLHELLRQYGAERLGEWAEAVREISDRHCSYYAHFMERQWSRLLGSEIKAALKDINSELDNVRAAWDWAVSHRKAAKVEAMLYSLGFFYGVGTRYQEGQQVFATAVSAFIGDTAIYGKLMARWGDLCYLTGSTNKAKSVLEESLSLLRQVDARDDIPFALYRLAMCFMNLDPDSPTVTAYLEESLAIYTELDDHYGMGEVLFQWGEFHRNQHIDKAIDGASQRAQQCFQESLVAYQQHSSAFGIALAHLGLSGIAHWTGDFRQSWHDAQISLDFCRELGIGWGINSSLGIIAYSACFLGEYAEARRYALERLSFILKSGWQNRDTWIVLQLHLAAAILLGERHTERAYELLGLVDQQCQRLNVPKDGKELMQLRLLDGELSQSLAAAVERGRTYDLDLVAKEILIELSHGANTPLPTHMQEQPHSQRELEILRLLADGLNSREIAGRLHLSVTTIRWYLRQLYSKLDAHSRSEAIARAKELKLLT